MKIQENFYPKRMGSGCCITERYVSIVKAISAVNRNLSWFWMSGGKLPYIFVIEPSRENYGPRIILHPLNSL